MAHRDSWPLIQKYGLLSTSALLDLFKMSGAERVAIESTRRPQTVDISHPRIGSATIRDQKPLRDSALENCLIDMTPKQWYQTLNGYIFFWPTEQRLLRMLGAGAYRTQDHIVLEVDTKSLVGEYSDSIKLSPINSGATTYNPPARGPATFSEFANYDHKEVAEVVIPAGVPDILDFISVVGVRNVSGRVDRIWP